MQRDELRAMFEAKVAEFSMSDRLPPEVARRGRRRIGFAVVRVFGALLLLVGGGSAVARFAEPSPTPPRVAVPVTIQLADDYVEGDGHEPRDHEVSRVEIDRHVACMREQGFDLPDPERTDDGWMVRVHDPESLGWNTPQWREAAFVACRVDPPPGRGDLVMGIPISRAEIESFRECLSREGFELPEPVANEPEGWRFDLEHSAIDFGDEAWNRAVFVTCWIEGHDAD